MNIADGVYNATITAAAVYEKNGLKLELHLSLCDENGNGYTQTGSDGKEYPLEKRMFYTLISNEGAVNTKVIDFIKAWAPAWDGVDPFWYTDVANTDAINTCMVAVLSVMAQISVIKYNDTKRIMPRMASTCFTFFMGTSCVYYHVSLYLSL